MTRNIYDSTDFFDRYAQLPRSVQGLPGAPEWPVLQRMLPAPAGRRVLDLGCGYGWFCRWARQAGAAQVLGVDVSARMLARARAEPAVLVELIDKRGESDLKERRSFGGRPSEAQ
jgi:SAM-dependent methyltransferase